MPRTRTRGPADETVRAGGPGGERGVAKNQRRVNFDHPRRIERTRPDGVSHMGRTPQLLLLLSFDVGVDQNDGRHIPPRRKNAATSQTPPGRLGSAKLPQSSTKPDHTRQQPLSREYNLPLDGQRPPTNRVLPPLLNVPLRSRNELSSSC